MSRQYCLRWKNHRNNLLDVFAELLKNESMTDVIIAIDGGITVKCHKMVLASCSTYFQMLFTTMQSNCNHPIVVLRDITYRQLRILLDYMYHGEVQVSREELTPLLAIAEGLQIKGLTFEYPINDVADIDLDQPGPSTSRLINRRACAPSNYDTSSTKVETSSTQASCTPCANVATLSNILQTNMPFTVSTNDNQSQYPSVSPQHHHFLLQHHSRHFISQVSNRPRISDDVEMREVSGNDDGNGNQDTPILRNVLGREPAEEELNNSPSPSEQSTSNVSLDESRRTTSGRSRSNNMEVEPQPSTSSQALQLYAPPPASQSSGSRSSRGGGSSSSGKSNGQKPEWKRYKQYTREDMTSAIDAVSTGLSALQAARKYGVPPRTLYDKVKKLGITTPRPPRRSSSSNGSCGSVNSSASFPYGIGGNVNGAIYQNMSHRRQFEDNELDNGSDNSSTDENSVESPPFVIDEDQEKSKDGNTATSAAASRAGRSSLSTYEKPGTSGCSSVLNLKVEPGKWIDTDEPEDPVRAVRALVSQASLDDGVEAADLTVPKDDEQMIKTIKTEKPDDEANENS